MKPLIRVAAVAAALFIASTTTGAAQAVNACYVPAVGAIYLIGLPGLPTACLTAGHSAVTLSGGGGGTPADGSVSTAKIQDGAVIASKLGDGAVSGPKLAPNAVGAAHIASASVNGSKIVEGAVAASHIATDAVGPSQIAANAVGSSEIANGAVTTAKLAAPMSVAGATLANVSGLGTTATNLGSITITAPAAGRVLITLSGYAVFFGDNTTLRIGLGSSLGAMDLHEVAAGRLDGSGTLRYEHTFAPTAVVNVVAGTRTFYATALKPSVFSANVINLSSLRLTALYIPN